MLIISFANARWFLAPFDFCIVEDDWETVARTFAQLHVALDDGLEHQFLEVSLHLVVNLVGKAETAVVHGEQEAFDLEFRVELALDDLDGVEQFADTFKSEIFALHRDDDAVGCCQRVDGDESERRRTVDEDVVIFVADRLQECLDHLLAILEIQHLYLGTHQVDMARNDVESINVGGVDGIADICMVDDALVERAVYLA